MGLREHLAAIFSEMAVLYELSGENEFKVRAYEQASRILQESSLSLSEIELNPPKGIGKGLLEKIREFQVKGYISDHNSLLKKIPSGVFDLLKIQGLGPKRVKVLFSDYGVGSLELLETMCLENRLSSIKGFGEKIQKNILEGVEFVRKSAKNMLFPMAEFQAMEVLKVLNGSHRLFRFMLAGSLRRKMEIVRNINLVTDCGCSEVLSSIAQSSLNYQVIKQSFNSLELMLGGGIKLDLVSVKPEHFFSALCWYTGSREFNWRLTEIGEKKGLSYTSNGVFEKNKLHSGNSEEDIFNFLNLPFIPPELRENQGEIEWALENRVFDLVEETNLKGTIHVHTSASDGSGTLSEMAHAAKSYGLTWLGVSDHSKSSRIAHGMSVEKVQKQWELIQNENASWRGLKIFKGIECDILPDGSLDYDPEILSKFDFVISSIHSNFSMPLEEMTVRILRAVENPFTNVLGHPTGRLLLSRKGYEVDLNRVLAACEKNGVAVEINAYPDRLDLDWRWVRKMRESGLKFFITPDAHKPEDFENLRFGVGIARKGGIDKGRVLNCLSAEEAALFFRKRKKR